MRLWRPIPGIVWDVEWPFARAGLFGLFFVGWGLVLYSSFLIDHFDLFGVRQVYLHLKKQAYTHPPFATPPLYKAVRNPLMLGVLMIVPYTLGNWTGARLFRPEAEKLYRWAAYAIIAASALMGLPVWD